MKKIIRKATLIFTIAIFALLFQGCDNYWTISCAYSDGVTTSGSTTNSQVGFEMIDHCDSEGGWVSWTRSNSNNEVITSFP